MLSKRIFTPGTSSPVPPDRYLGLTVGILSRAIGWSLTKRVEEYGVLPGAYSVIAWLIKIKVSTQSELCKLIGIEQPTMANTLNRLERDGLIERNPDPSHGRRTLVKLSPRGLEISKVMAMAAEDLQTVATDGLTAEQIDQFFAMADKMIENLSHERFG